MDYSFKHDLCSHFWSLCTLRSKLFDSLELPTHCAVHACGVFFNLISKVPGFKKCFNIIGIFLSFKTVFTSLHFFQLAHTLDCILFTASFVFQWSQVPNFSHVSVPLRVRLWCSHYISSSPSFSYSSLTLILLLALLPLQKSLRCFSLSCIHNRLVMCKKHLSQLFCFQMF